MLKIISGCGSVKLHVLLGLAMLVGLGIDVSAAPMQRGKSETPQRRSRALQFIIDGDSLYAALDFASALSSYQAAIAFDSTLSEPLWKSARSFVDAGDKADKKSKKDYYINAVRFARWAVRIDPGDSNAHLFNAISVGKLALFEGGKTKIKLSKEVRKEALIAISLDPDNDSAYHVIARWHREVANLSGVLKAFAKVLYGGVPAGASNDSSVFYFKKAVSLNPGHINHYLELGRTYMMMKQWKPAKSQLDKCLSLPSSAVGDPAYKKEARNLLMKVNKKLDR